MRELENMLFHMVRNNPRKLEQKEPVAPQDELVVHMLERAFDERRLNETQFKGNLKILWLTAHENTQQLLTTMFWKLGTDQVRKIDRKTIKFTA